jgi:hypothetical protein
MSSINEDLSGLSYIVQVMTIADFMSFGKQFASNLENNARVTEHSPIERLNPTNTELDINVWFPVSDKLTGEIIATHPDCQATIRKQSGLSNKDWAFKSAGVTVVYKKAEDGTLSVKGYRVGYHYGTKNPDMIEDAISRGVETFESSQNLESFVYTKGSAFSQAVPKPAPTPAQTDEDTPVL